MCYAGGPYCYKDMSKALARATKAAEESPTEQNQKKLRETQQKMMLTKEYIKSASDKNPEVGKKLQKVYDQRLESAKNYERIRDDNKVHLDAYTNEKQTVDAKIAELESARRVVEDAPEGNHIKTPYGRVMNAPGHIKRYTDRIDAQLAPLNKKSNDLDARIQVLKENNRENLKNHKSGKPMNYSQLMPQSFGDYYASTEKKHFVATSPGSTFTEAKNLNEVMALAHKQRGNLQGDDREKLINEHGADPTSFRDDKRYLMVETKGRLGSVAANSLPDDTILTVHQKAEGTKPVCVAEVSEKKEVNVATIVLADNPTLEGTQNHSSILITAYPGVSGARSDSEKLLPYVGQQITMKQARELYNGEDFSVNTILKKG